MFVIPCPKCQKGTYIGFFCAHSFCPDCCFKHCEHPKEEGYGDYPENWKGDPTQPGRVKD